MLYLYNVQTTFTENFVIPFCFICFNDVTVSSFVWFHWDVFAMQCITRTKLAQSERPGFSAIFWYYYR